jgi:catechol 2,3-dioxygenase-like lactoylglutathione lyase family enzyme
MLLAVVSSLAGAGLPELSADPAGSATGRSGFKQWTSVGVGVADLDQALELWSGTFGLEILEQRDGDDPELASLWGLSPGDIERQALLGTPGASHGLIHFVQFNDPGPAVRDGAEDFDSCPKNLDIYVHDLPLRVEELKARGWTFRNERHSEVTAPDGTKFREIHMPGHDGINFVLLEVIGKDLPFTQQGYAGVGPVITIVADARLERSFYREVMGLDLLNDNILEGPEIERMIGLPPGVALDVTIWGAHGESLGQMEVIEYRGVDGKDLYPLAVPKQRGILNVTYATARLAPLIRTLEQAGIPWADHGKRAVLTGQGRFIRFRTPAGFTIEAFE